MITVHGGALRSPIELREAFRRDGWVKCQLLAEDEVATMREEYHAVVAAFRAQRGSDEITTGADAGGLVYVDEPVLLQPAWRSGPFMTRAGQVAEALLGVPVVYKESEILHKSAGSAEETPWHQDAGYWLRLGVDVPDALVCWMALSDTSAAASGLQFVPGSHDSPLRPHRDRSGDWALPEALEVEVDDTVPVAQPTLSPGWATFHHYRTLHYSGPNTTGDDRCAVSVHFWPATALPAAVV